MVHDLLASRWRRFVANARRCGLSECFWIVVVTTIGRSLFDLDRNLVRVGEGVMANARYLPRNLHVRFIGANAELVATYLGSHDGLAQTGRRP